jgi:REP element-mobilizing transposase RayT
MITDHSNARPPTDVMAITSLPKAWVVYGLGKAAAERHNLGVTLPARKSLGHHRPTWVSESDPIFITICGAKRRVNQFTREPQWTCLVKSAEHMRQLRLWQPLLLLAMPDHVHLIVIITKSVGIDLAVWRFKRAASYGNQIKWQPAAFDHRIRSDDSYREKWHYILANPKRGGLIQDRMAWPYVKSWSVNTP